MRRPRTLILAAGLITLAAFSLNGCSSPIANRDPVGETFPTVVGESLDGEARTFPGDLSGRPAVLLLGYVQNAQFDADRWLLGLLQAQVDVPIYEVPTIRGLVPGLIAGTIDEGMRSGIPAEDWASVVTVYDDADRLVQFTGNVKPRNMRVLLLDPSGQVRWFHDRGYSAGTLLKLLAVLEEIRTSG